jgi:hypothetical protein
MYRPTPAGDEALAAAVTSVGETQLAIERLLCRYALVAGRAPARGDEDRHGPSFRDLARRSRP